MFKPHLSSDTSIKMLTSRTGPIISCYFRLLDLWMTCISVFAIFLSFGVSSLYTNTMKSLVIVLQLIMLISMFKLKVALLLIKAFKFNKCVQKLGNPSSWIVIKFEKIIYSNMLRLNLHMDIMYSNTFTVLIVRDHTFTSARYKGN